MRKEEVHSYRKRLNAQEELRKRGYHRVNEKAKEYRRSYRKSIEIGTRSGSSRLVQLHFDTLKDIWGGSPLLHGGITSFGESSLSDLMPNEANEEEEDNDDVDENVKSSGPISI